MIFVLTSEIICKGSNIAIASFDSLDYDDDVLMLSQNNSSNDRRICHQSL